MATTFIVTFRSEPFLPGTTLPETIELTTELVGLSHEIKGGEVTHINFDGLNPYTIKDHTLSFFKQGKVEIVNGSVVSTMLIEEACNYTVSNSENESGFMYTAKSCDFQTLPQKIEYSSTFQVFLKLPPLQLTEDLTNNTLIIYSVQFWGIEAE